MKKIFIGLLIIAAGTASYFLFIQKKNKPFTQSLNKELIIGKWITREAFPGDTVLPRHGFEFQKEGLVIRLEGDSVRADTAHYEWNKNNELLWKQSKTDSISKTFQVNKLTTDSLILQRADSSVLLFIKTK